MVVELFIIGGFVGLLSIRIFKFLLSLFMVKNRGVMMIGLGLELVMLFGSLAMILVSFENTTYIRMLYFALISASVMAVDMMIIEPIGFGVQCLAAKYGKKNTIV